jgi:adenine-specific DNA methylase
MANWHDLFPPRQRVVIETLLGACGEAAKGDTAVLGALQAVVIGSTEMAGYTSRWDARYLKAYEAMANHRFSFTTLAVEPNVFGTNGVGRGTVERRLDHMAKAVAWLDEQVGHRPVVQGPMPASAFRSALAQDADARVVSGSSARLCIQAKSVDAVVTDPAYHDDVQYQELSDLFRAWAGEPTGAIDGDAVVRPGKATSTEAYRTVLTEVFNEIRRALRPDGHLVLSYANREPVAWVALLSALDEAGFRAVGYEIVHSENETDHAKSGRRACNLDVLLDLVPAGDQFLRRHSPSGKPKGDEETYCRIVGAQALEVGRLAPGWETSLRDKLHASPFLT